MPVVSGLVDTEDFSPLHMNTLLIVSFDEHGGTFDHVAPDAHSDSPLNFDFTRLGVRVPTLLTSPLIPSGRVFRAPGSMPSEHTSLLRTILGWSASHPSWPAVTCPASRPPAHPAAP